MAERRRRGAYTIRWSHEAEGDLAFFRAGVQSAVRKAVPVFLQHQPALDAGQRRRLEPNPLEASWRLQVGEYRVLYEVDDAAREVRILHVGHKPADTLYVRGKAVAMRVA